MERARNSHSVRPSEKQESPGFSRGERQEADTCISDNLSAGVIVDDDFIFQQVELISLCCDMYKFIRGICKDYSHLFVSRIDDGNLKSMPDVVFAMRMRELGIDVNKLEGEV